MIALGHAVKVWAWSEPVDGRLGFDGLLARVVRHLGRRPVPGEVFLFTNRRRKMAKALLWDGTGLCIFQKRLAAGCFARLWGAAPGEPLRLTASELGLYLEGAKLTGRLPLSPPEKML